MTLTVGGLNLQDFNNGYVNFRLLFGDPITGVAEVSGERVLIPGSPGFFTPSSNFEERRLLIGMKGTVTGSGADHATIATSFSTRWAALRSACDVATRSDVTIVADGYTIQAGFVRFEHPFVTLLDAEALETIIEFEATDPPEWELVGS